MASKMWTKGSKNEGSAPRAPFSVSDSKASPELNKFCLSANDIEIMAAAADIELAFAAMLDQTMDFADLFREADSNDYDPYVAGSRFYDNGLGSGQNTFNSTIIPSDEYIFFSQDSCGNILNQKKMKPIIGKRRFRIELDVKGIDPENVHIDTVENQMTISLKKQRKSKGRVRQSVFGIICPSVEALDKLCVHYPKNGQLLIEGPKS